MDNRTARLRQLMQRHNLSAADVAEILGRTAQTVRVWRCDNEQTIPADALRVLEFTLARRGRVHA
jgi:transcriptional regulator with XRE-family HTH domain